ncbi:hypothetical protein CBU02nite_31490 [Clostridium butyricum]|jgi:hypothetical protein|uniref:Uncharacterized protein n=1 Tax=Clostridium butyricum TaxID=1492 RepID=A0A512TRA9_CLOBU|nr:hypothetical protein [Clostridium butyricum]NOW25271.1 hypothetical protein [Clostridium butyricum]GEQ22643.1 hypothetical protein CBU02nite_31490 [Clostridium butyricum]
MKINNIVKCNLNDNRKTKESESLVKIEEPLIKDVIDKLRFQFKICIEKYVNMA